MKASVGVAPTPTPAPGASALFPPSETWAPRSGEIDVLFSTGLWRSPAYSPTNRELFYAYRGVWHTTDAGVSWAKIPSPPDVVIAAFPHVREIRERNARELKPLLGAAESSAAIMAEAAAIGREYVAHLLQIMWAWINSHECLLSLTALRPYSDLNKVSEGGSPPHAA